MPGDCVQDLCVIGEVQQIADDAQLPEDNNVCTDNVCNQGVPGHPPFNPGVACIGMGEQEVCDGAGSCVECVVEAHCEQIVIDEPDCEQPLCMNNNCVADFTMVGTALNASQQTSGDCELVVCDGSGNRTTQTDGADAPNDGNPCTVGSCNGNMPRNRPLQAWAHRAARCWCATATAPAVGCNTPADCPTASECLGWLCQGNSCVQDPTPEFTLTSNQVAENCLMEVCDGMGGTRQDEDPGDPIDDMLECTADQCDMGTPINPALPVDDPCAGGTMFCDGGGACVQCNFNPQCTGDDGVCEDDLCQMNSCNIVPHASGVNAPPSGPGDGRLPELRLRWHGRCRSDHGGRRSRPA